LATSFAPDIPERSVVVQINNPDQRVVILKEFVKTNFPSTPLLDYALEVEKITTAKVGRVRLVRLPMTHLVRETGITRGVVGRDRVIHAFFIMT